MNRRWFLGTMLALGAAPAIVRAESLMKIVVPKLILPNGGYTVGLRRLYGDGIHDDTNALQAFFDGLAVVDNRTGLVLGDTLSLAQCKITSTIVLANRSQHVRFADKCTFIGDLKKSEPMFSVPFTIKQQMARIENSYLFPA